MNAQSRSAAPKHGSLQTDLFHLPQSVPDGFRYQRDLITPAEEAVLVRQLDDLPFEPFDFHGYLAHRHVVGFGWRYDYAGRRLKPAAAIPDWLMALREMVGRFAQRPPDAFVQVLINQYRAGAGIGWHRDKPQFDEVVGVSLLSACPLRFRLKDHETWRRQTAYIDARSAYLLSGPARRQWEHSIAPVVEARYSITFRTMAADCER